MLQKCIGRKLIQSIKMLIVQGQYSSLSKGWKNHKTIYTSCTQSYIYTDVNLAKYVRKGTISTVCFIYKSRVLKTEKNRVCSMAIYLLIGQRPHFGFGMVIYPLRGEGPHSIHFTSVRHYGIRIWFITQCFVF